MGTGSTEERVNNLTDLLITNGTIVDGTGSEAFIGDVAIEGGRITALGKDLLIEAKEKIDVSGLIVSPGFIDVHSHNDLVPFREERLKSLKLKQGVTTELVGQCGLGVVPCREEEDCLWKSYIRGVVGDIKEQWDFKNMKDYMKKLTLKGTKNNYAVLVSHGAIRTKVLGFENRVPSEKELRTMCEMVQEAMEAGAFGMSIGLQYMPAVYSKREELIAMCSVVRHYDGIIMVHLRNHDDSILSAMEEIVEIAESSGVRLHISHLRSYASEDLGCKAEALIEAVENASKRGVKITFDEHLYLSGSTLMTQLLPPWVTQGGSEAMIARLKNKDTLEKLKVELSDTRTHYTGWDNYSLITGWQGILITSVNKKENLKYIGRTVGEIAEELNMHPVEFAAELLLVEQIGVGIVTMNVFSEADTIKLIRHPLQMVGSDSIPAGVPHPRLYGNYPLFFGKFVREKSALSLEEAVYKASGLPARTLGMEDIGVIAVNKAADITIFDLNKIKGYEDYRNSTMAPDGIKYVIINGEIVLKPGVVLENSYGKVIKKQAKE